MELFIFGRNGERYELKILNRKQKIEIHNLMKDSQEENFEKIESLFYTLLKFNNPNLSKEEFEDILDYNCETYGFEETYEMVSYLIEDVFTAKGGDKIPNPYLMKKKEEKKNATQD